MARTIPIAASSSQPAKPLPWKSQRTRRFHTMVKPSGSQCNLDCSYCFYLHKEELLQQPRMPRMAEPVLEAHVRQLLQAQPAGEVVFSWQGGEPTLMGLEFFERVLALQKRHARSDQRVENDLQTNGVLIDETWAAFLKQHGFLVGLSIDGPAELHDIYRRTKGDTPSFDRVMRARNLLAAHGVPFNALCVVNRRNARRPMDVYRFLRDVVKPRLIQFIPCVEPLDFRHAAPSESLVVESPVTEWSVGAEDWGYFLDRVWREWLRRDYGRVFVDQFENVISQLFGFGAQKCVSSECCGQAMALEHNGDLYSCDHFVYPAYKLGNILVEHEGDLAVSPAQLAFGAAKRNTLPAYCKSCEFLQLCWGECPKNRFMRTPEGEAGLNYLCPGLKKFYATVSGSREQLARLLKQPVPAALQ